MLSPDKASDYKSKLKQQQERLRSLHAEKSVEKSYLELGEARKKGFSTDWEKTDIVKPAKIGVEVFKDIPIEEAIQFIDWSPFFWVWELKGVYPKIFKNKEYGNQAKQLYDDARGLLKDIAENKRFNPRAVVGIWPANSNHDDVEVYKNEKRKNILTTLSFLRQQHFRGDKETYYCLSDFIAPKDTGKKDYIGAFVVTAGEEVDEYASFYKNKNDDYNAIMVQAIGDRVAEALAEMYHETIRKEIWGYVKDEKLSNEDLIKEKYLGIRPAPGYPSCPDHTEKEKLWELLQAENHTGVRLTETYAMTPGSSVAGYYFSHPESRYFNLGKIQKDQTRDYAKRKGLKLKEVEKWLQPNLGY